MGCLLGILVFLFNLFFHCRDMRFFLCLKEGNYFMKAIQKSSIQQWFLFLVFGLLAQLTMAAGLEAEATSMITTIRNVIYAIVGVVATICLLWQMAQGFMGRKTWGDILESCLWIVGAGAAIALATWLFSKGASMTF